jgi:dihydroorotase
MKSNTASLLIENGHLIDPSQSISGNHRILIVDGIIAAIDPSDGDIPSDVPTLDATGLIVAPGLVDLATELREPGFEEDETITTGGHAAIAGGFTSILASGNTNPCIDSAAAVEFVRQKAAQADGPRVHVIGCVSMDREGDQMAELGLLVEAGAVAFSDGPRPLTNAALLKRALEYCRMFNRPIFDRPGIPELSEGGVMHNGQVSLVLGLRGLPTETEDLAVARNVRLVEATGGRLHIGPISTMGSIDLIRRVKERNIQVTASVCPHNLCLSDEALRSFDSRFKVHPPLRSVRHVDALKQAVATGTIDAIQSGHMPRSREKKMDDLDQAPFGLSSLETTLSTVATHLVATKVIDWVQAIRIMSTRPAQIAGIEAGTLAVGRLGDVVLIDPNERYNVDSSEFFSTCVSTPLEGESMIGRVKTTILGGQIRYDRSRAENPFGWDSN